MFEITDDFLAQAGFSALSDEQKTSLKEQVSMSVQRKIGDRIVTQVGEERAEELTALMDGGSEQAKKFLQSVDVNYRESDAFKGALEISLKAGASEDEITKEYAVLMWMKHNQVPVAEVVQESMNDAMVELQTIYQQAAKMAGDRRQESGE